MNKQLKKILVTGASLLMFTSVGVGFSSVNHTANAANVAELQNNPKLFHNPYRSIPENVNHNFNKHGYTFDVKTIRQQMARNDNRPADYDPIIIGVNGHVHISNHKVIRALEGHHINLPRHRHKKYYRKHTRKHYRKARKYTRKHLRRHSHRR